MKPPYILHSEMFPQPVAGTPDAGQHRLLRNPLLAGESTQRLMTDVEAKVCL